MLDEEKSDLEFAKLAAPPSALGQNLVSGLSDLPLVLTENLKQLEMWASLNHQDARRDAMKFWALKAPAILISACPGLFAYWKINGLSVICGVIASACIAIDGLLRAGLLRNVHIRAFHEIRALQNDLRMQWQIGILQREDQDKLLARILKDTSDERRRIEGYIKAAETSLPETKTK